MATKSKVVEVQCECGNRWYATFRSGVVKRMVLCGYCGKETPTAKNPKKVEPDVCPQCKRPDFQNPKHDYLSCKFCKYEIFGRTFAKL